MQKIKEKLHIGKNKQQDEFGYENNTGYDNTNTLGATGATGVHNGLGATGMNTSNTSYRDDAVERPVAIGVAEVPVVVTEQERLGHQSRHEGVVGERRGLGVGEEVCGTKTFTEVEDRPVVKERVERILEHNPVEKQYVVETRFVGEVPIGSATGATVIDTSERVIEAAGPGARCPANAGQIMDGVIGSMGTDGMSTGHHHGLGRDRV